MPINQWSETLVNFHSELNKFGSPPAKFTKIYQTLCAKGTDGFEDIVEDIPELVEYLVLPFHGKSQEEINNTQAQPALRPCYYAMCVLDLMFQETACQLEAESDEPLEERNQHLLTNLSTIRGCLEAWLVAHPTLTLGQAVQTSLYQRYETASEYVSNWFSETQQSMESISSTIESMNDTLSTFCHTVKLVTQVDLNYKLLQEVYSELTPKIKLARTTLPEGTTETALLIKTFSERASQAVLETDQIVQQVNLPASVPTQDQLREFLKSSKEKIVEMNPEKVHLYSQCLQLGQLTTQRQQLTEIVELVQTVIG